MPSSAGWPSCLPACSRPHPPGSAHPDQPGEEQRGRDSDTLPATRQSKHLHPTSTRKTCSFFTDRARSHLDHVGCFKCLHCFIQQLFLVVARQQRLLPFSLCVEQDCYLLPQVHPHSVVGIIEHANESFLE